MAVLTSRVSVTGWPFCGAEATTRLTRSNEEESTESTLRRASNKIKLAAPTVGFMLLKPKSKFLMLLLINKNRREKSILLRKLWETIFCLGGEQSSPLFFLRSSSLPPPSSPSFYASHSCLLPPECYL